MENSYTLSNHNKAAGDPPGYETSLPWDNTDQEATQENYLVLNIRTPISQPIGEEALASQKTQNDL
jgi:hypothetical protein